MIVLEKNNDDFNQFVRRLQEEIDEEELARFSKKVIEEFHNPKNWGRMSEPNAQAIIKGPCGDTMEIYLKIENNICTKASFFTDGCGPTVACGSKLTSTITNKSIAEIRKITSADLLKALDGLPPENEHCAILAVNTLQEAVLQC